MTFMPEVNKYPFKMPGAQDYSIKQLQKFGEDWNLIPEIKAAFDEITKRYKIVAYHGASIGGENIDIQYTVQSKDKQLKLSIWCKINCISPQYGIYYATRDPKNNNKVVTLKGFFLSDRATR